MSGSAFDKWTCVFPGKMGICWKRATFFSVGTKEEAEKEASRWGNVVAVPLALAEKIDEYNKRTVAAERELAELKAKSAKQERQRNRSYLAERFCDHCGKDTEHFCRDSDHERDSSDEYQECQECRWHKFGFSSEYSPPIEF